MGRDSMGHDEQWMRLALAVLTHAEADYKISTIRLRQSKRYTADNIGKLHQEFETPVMVCLCPRGIEDTLAFGTKNTVARRLIRLLRKKQIPPGHHIRD